MGHIGVESKCVMAVAIVFHSDYGCESGCCGHTVQIPGRSKFVFDHPRWVNGVTEDDKAFIKRIVTETFGEEHVKDIDWDTCVVCED